MRTVIVVAALIASVCAASTATAGVVPGYVHWTCNGAEECPKDWVTSPISIDWTVDASASGNCPDVTIRDDPGRTVTCEVSKDAIVTVPITIKLDQQAPVIGEPRPDRPPDHAGWYTHPVGFATTATDVTSGFDRCDPVTYSGPDNVAGRAVVTCWDKARNAASRAVPLSYDGTPPDLSGATISTGDHVVRLSWPAGADARVTRTPGTDGQANSMIYEGTGTGFADREVRNHRKYRYVLTLTDQAGNTASRELAAKPQRQLLAPQRAATLAAPPLLKWTPVRHTRYYNVQLFRDGHKILSRWPRQASLQLKQKWRFHGKRYRLKPDEYHWYVWPGEGRRAANRYGDRIGRRSFTVLPG